MACGSDLARSGGQTTWNVFLAIMSTNPGNVGPARAFSSAWML
jgi:hypothetical protein